MPYEVVWEILKLENQNKEKMPKLPLVSLRERE